MKHPWFNIRLGLVGVILLVVYFPIIWLVYDMVGIGMEYSLFALCLILGFQYWWGNRSALKSVEAEELDEDNDFTQLVHTHAKAMDVKPPKVSLGEFGSPNAFAIGRKRNGHVVFSKMLVNILDDKELEAVVVHELSHLKSRDTIPMVIGQGSASVIYFLGLVFFPRNKYEKAAGQESRLARLSHTFVMMFVFVISRQREFIADADTVEQLGSSKHIKNALINIRLITQRTETKEPPEQAEALCINSGWKVGNLLSTHPSLDDRVEKAQEYDKNNLE